MTTNAFARPSVTLEANGMAGLAVDMENFFPALQKSIGEILVVAVVTVQQVGVGNVEDL
jgi:hypothetical protein